MVPPERSFLNRPIGVFDSGVGGLTVAREILRQLPGERLLYLGDTARVPYGPRGPATITRFALEMAQFLLDREVKALVVACNSISATALDAIRAIAPVPVVDVIAPTVRAGLAATRSGVIGVAGTVATVNSGVYERLAEAWRPGVRVDCQACPLFVPIVEEGLGSHAVAELMAEEYCGRFRDSAADVLILGCTHYPVLEETLARVLGPRIRLIGSAEPTARALAELFPPPGIGSAPSRPPADPPQRCTLRHELPPRHRFFVTDASYKFLRIANHILGDDVSECVEQVSIEGLAGEQTDFAALPTGAARHPQPVAG